MNVDYFRYATAVERAGSFSAAAQSLAITQPALSNGVARLERHLGGKLFVRSRSGTSPTTFGDMLLPKMAEAIAAVDSVADFAARMLTRSTPTMRAGVSPLIDASLVGAAFAAARSLAPARNLVLREADLGDLRKALDKGELDFILVPSLPSPPGFCARVVAAEPMAVIQSASGQTAAVGAAIDIADLAASTLLLVPDTCGLTAFTRDLFRVNDLRMRTYPGEAASYRVLEDWAAMGLGSALLPLSRVNRSHGRVHPVTNGQKKIIIRYEVVWREDSTLIADISSIAESISNGSAALAVPTEAI